MRQQLTVTEMLDSAPFEALNTAELNCELNKRLTTVKELHVKNIAIHPIQVLLSVLFAIGTCV